MALALVLAVAGCDRPAANPPAPAVSVSAATGPVEPAPSTTPSDGLAFGQARTFVGEATAAVTVHGYTQPVATDAPKPDPSGQEWGAADVQMCVQSAPPSRRVTVSWRHWALIYRDGAVVTPSTITYRQFPAPTYPDDDDRAIPVGRCVRGWITFAVPAGSKPAMVEYQAPEIVIDWRVP